MEDKYYEPDNVKHKDIRSSLTCITADESKLAAKIHGIEDIFKYVNWQSVFLTVDDDIIFTEVSDLHKISGVNKIIVNGKQITVNSSNLGLVSHTYVFNENALCIQVQCDNDVEHANKLYCALRIGQSYDLTKMCIKYNDYEILLQDNDNFEIVVNDPDCVCSIEQIIRVTIKNNKVKYNYGDGLITSENNQKLISEFMPLYHKLVDIAARITTDDNRLLSVIFPKDYEYIDRKLTINKCCVCLTKDSVVVFVPCGHLVVCFGCAIQINDNDCPICRQHVTNTITVYT